MTTISFTSGQIMDIIGCIEIQRKYYYDNSSELKSSYYKDLISQFESILEKLQELPGEKREATLVLAMN